MTKPHNERRRRWRLALGGDDNEALSERDLRMDQALAALYERGEESSGKTSKNRRGGLGASAPRVSRWLGDIRGVFPAPGVQVIQRDAFDRLGLRAVVVGAQFLAALGVAGHLGARPLS